MANFFEDNTDLKFVFDTLELKAVTDLIENGYEFAKQFDNAPRDYADARDNYKRALQIVGEICAERIEPRSSEIDANGPTLENGVVTYNPLTIQNLKDLTQAGVMGVMLEHKYGGLNFPVTIYAMLTEMVSRADGSLQNIFGLQDIAETISQFGSDDQKDKYLPLFAEGKLDGAMDLTEPDYGSDLQAVRLRAWQDENGQWYLNGVKRFITNGCAKVHLVLARSEEGTTDGRGLSMFICEKCPQLVVRRIENKLGIHGVATCELQFNDVPAQLCGKRRFGLIRYVMSLMNGARIAISSQAVGIAEAAYRDARKYAAEREQFKKTIDNFPAVYRMLSSMKVTLTAARALLYETTRVVDLRGVYGKLVDSGNATVDDKALSKYYTRLASTLTPMCKALATEAANKIAYDGLQIHGGSGYMKDFKAERYTRDARITNIYEGTTQLQVVAAIGGILMHDLDKRIEELFSIQLDGGAVALKEKLAVAKTAIDAAIDFVTKSEEPEYHDLVARDLVEAETMLFIGLLLLRDASKSDDRFVIAERFVLDNIPEISKRCERIISGDVTLINKKRDIIDY